MAAAVAHATGIGADLGGKAMQLTQPLLTLLRPSELHPSYYADALVVFPLSGLKPLASLLW
jgi:hypothetical protein